MDGSILDLGGSHGTHGRPSPSEDGTVGVGAEGQGGEGGEGRGVDIASKALARHLRVRRDGWWPHPETERVPLLEMKHCR